MVCSGEFFKIFVGSGAFLPTSYFWAERRIFSVGSENVENPSGLHANLGCGSVELWSLPIPVVLVFKFYDVVIPPTVVN